MVSYESFYMGAESNLMPKYRSLGYQVDVGDIGMALDARTANQLGELNTKLNPGQKVVEIGAVQADVWESIPTEHFEEMRRVMELTGVQPTVHAPLIEASGYGKEGWSESERRNAERQLTDAVLKSHRLNPEGNFPVTMHSTSGLPEMRPMEKTEEGILEPSKLMVIDPETGRTGAIGPQKRYFPEEGKFAPEKKQPFKPDEELRKINEEIWARQLSDINRHADYGGGILNKVGDTIPAELFAELAEGKNVEQIEKLKESEYEEKEKFRNAQREINHGRIYLRDSYRNLKELFNKVYPTVSSEEQAKLRKFAEHAASVIGTDIETNPKRIKEFGEIIEEGLKALSEIKTPNIYQPLNEFIIDKSATTFANVALKAYDEFGKKAPIVSIENPPAGGGLSRAEDLMELIKASREKMVQKLVDEKGISKSEAKDIAEKMIGATWDVGHINMLRKYGYSEEEVIKQSEMIAPYVKHVHLSDNFGFEHTELPMGMGNVPMKQIMKKLGQKGFEAKKIVEAGNWWQYFADKGGGNPFRPTIEAFDSPIYAMKAGPSWSEMGGFGTYYSGHGPINPFIHHQTYGGGFTSLPAELGGTMPGEASRFAGTPNQ